jgi:hypothetical protein
MNVEEWKSIPQWVCWKSVYAGELRKPRKVPKNPMTGHNAKFNDPSTWATAREAWAAKNRMGFDGITFVHTEESGVVGVDLDNCISANGVPNTMAVRIVNLLRSRTEYSPSGTGLHIFCVGKVPGNVHQPQTGYEMYANKHGLTVTGRLFRAENYGLPRLPETLEERSDELCALYMEYSPPPPPKRERPSYGSGQSGAISVDDIRGALKFVPKVMDYQDWVRVLMAVHSVYPGDTGVSLVEEWSPGQPGEVEEKFRGFPDDCKVSVGTLFHFAKQGGWTKGNAHASGKR